MTDKPHRVSHDSFGLLHFARWSGSHAQTFFGSDIKHDRGIRMTLMSACRERSLNADRFYEEDLVAAVDMTEAQFAEILTTLNIGTGVPVTIKSMRDGDIVIPAPPPETPKGEVVLEEARTEAREGVAEMRRVLKALRGLLEEGKLRKQGVKALIDELDAAIRVFDDRVPFMIEQFSRTVEKMVVDAMATIRAGAPPVVIESLSGIEDAVHQGVLEDQRKGGKRKKDKKSKKKK